MNIELKTTLDRFFGESGLILHKPGEVKYHCPYCHHHKHKLQVNLDTYNTDSFGRFKCWVCKKSGNLITLYKLFNATKNQFITLRSIMSNVNTKYSKTIGNDGHRGRKQVLRLPSKFKSLLTASPYPEYKHAVNYSKKRGLKLNDILRYNIGYIEEGEYSGMLIIPSYDEKGELNFFTGRSFFSSVKFNKHKNPSWSKNIIANELFINWSEPITIVEGPLDAVAVKRNAIPLYGKNISNKLKIKILEEEVKCIYIALDSDAMNEIIPIAEEFFNNGINIYIVELNDKDPSDMGYIKFMEQRNKTIPLTRSRLMKLKMGL